HWHARFESDPGTMWLRKLVVDTLADPDHDGAG
ncbi:LysR family transcriptional regulator, partial [Achromobacter arsenitoxydans SY8]